MLQFVTARLPPARDVEPDADPLGPQPIQILEGSDDEHSIDEEDEVAEPESKVWVMRDGFCCADLQILG